MIKMLHMKILHVQYDSADCVKNSICSNQAIVDTGHHIEHSSPFSLGTYRGRSICPHFHLTSGPNGPKWSPLPTAEISEPQSGYYMGHRITKYNIALLLSWVHELPLGPPRAIHGWAFAQQSWTQKSASLQCENHRNSAYCLSGK